MAKKVEVLGIVNDANLGLIAGCRAPEWDGMNEAEIKSWFEEHRQLTFEDGAVLVFSGIIPFATACFGGANGQAILRLDNATEATVNTPRMARLV